MCPLMHANMHTKEVQKRKLTVLHGEPKRHLMFLHSPQIATSTLYRTSADNECKLCTLGDNLGDNLLFSYFKSAGQGHYCLLKCSKDSY